MEWLVAGVGLPGRDGPDDSEAEADARGVPEAEALALVARLLAALLVVAWPVAARLVVAEPAVAEDPPLAGDGVCVFELVADPDDDVSGAGVKVAGIEEPPAVQAETANASRTAPAARRPAVSHASRIAASLVGAGVLSRIFMDPPHTRVRYTR